MSEQEEPFGERFERIRRTLAGMQKTAGELLDEVRAMRISPAPMGPDFTKRKIQECDDSIAKLNQTIIGLRSFGAGRETQRLLSEAAGEYARLRRELEACLPGD